MYSFHISQVQYSDMHCSKLFKILLRHFDDTVIHLTGDDDHTVSLECHNSSACPNIKLVRL